MKKYYAVKVGRKSGIYETWAECKEQVDGYKGAQYKSFTTLLEANAFISVPLRKEVIREGLLAYVDGSYNLKKQVYGYGCVCLENQQVIKELYGQGNDIELVGMRNVAGEILGCEVAVQYAIEHGYSSIFIYYDYEGIEKWAIGAWKTNKVGTIAYAKKMQEYKKEIQIEFIKVLAHSGDVYNERADQLAKKAVGIK